MKSRMNYVSTVSIDICSLSFCFCLYYFIIIMMSLAEKSFDSDNILQFIS